MYLYKCAALSSATVLLMALLPLDAFAANDPCKILTAEKFSEIMGYKAKIVSSSEAVCSYKGAGDAGGMLMIVSEEATPQMLAMANGPESIPHGNPGSLGRHLARGLFSSRSHQRN